MNKNKFDKPMFICNGSCGFRVNLDDVMYATSDHNHCSLVMADGKSHALSFQLGQLEPELCAHGLFVRIHRQTIVNVCRVDKILGNILILDNGERLSVGKTFRNCLDEYITMLNVYDQRK